MRYKSSKKIREEFIKFFEQRGHKFIKSSSVVPLDDPTLLFTNAGMNQFKDIFLGKISPRVPSAVNSQKCIRAGGKHNDLEDVGLDGYHHTFFEMLGNWSFGNYYKKEAILWAWQFLTKNLEMPKNKLYATVHNSDKETYNLWKNCTDIDPKHIEMHGDKDNFWEMGATGPCGPCSEIHIDMGKEDCNLADQKEHRCKVNGNCHRFLELWNLVFIQFNRQKNGTLAPLKNKYVDTGAGLERICRVVQKKSSNYQTDIFKPIIDKIKKIAKVKDEVAFRVISDHIRTLSFAISDGGLPSNEGAGYVLRRILRRASRFGRVIGLKEPFLYKLLDSVIEVMGEHYSQLLEKKEFISMIIKSEEERFGKTLDIGIQKFNEITKKSKKISAENAFLLYDTFGFPLDLTCLMAKEKKIEVDFVGFETFMKQQRLRAQKSAKFGISEESFSFDIKVIPKTEFVGYKVFENKAKIIKYTWQGDVLIFVLDKTPFYAFSGGQLADIGTIEEKECLYKVFDVKKVGEVFVHYAKKIRGNNRDLKNSICRVNKENRLKVSANHTATHILQSTLKNVLGNFVEQKGSLVKDSSLRFDFVFTRKINIEEIRKIEEKINIIIRANLPVLTREMTIEKAKDMGAMALFGEKYGKIVRVVSIGDISNELCGGTHIDSTGQIGLFKIISEGSIASGIRRIVAVTGSKAERFLYKQQDKLLYFAQKLACPENKIQEKLSTLLNEKKSAIKEIEKLQNIFISSQIEEFISKAIFVKGIKLVVGELSKGSNLRQSSSILKEKMGIGLGALFVKNSEKINLSVIVDKSLTNRLKAGEVVAEIAKIVGGRGGGRHDIAFAGGGKPELVNKAMAFVKTLIERDL